MEERVAEAAANKMTAEEKNAWYKQHLTMQAAPLSVTVAVAAEAANLMKDTQNLFVRQQDAWTFYCHLCKKVSDPAHLATQTHRDAVELSATISWMCGGLPRILRTPHMGAPASGNIWQQMCKAWWGPYVDNMRAQALFVFANLDTVTFQTKTKAYSIPARELEIGSLWIVLYEGEFGNYERHESKTCIKTVAAEWSSIPPGLPLSADGAWPAPTNEEEDAMCRVRADCMLANQPQGRTALRSFNIGSSATPGQASGASGSGAAPLNYGNWPVLTWHPSSQATAYTLWLFSEEGYEWVSCIIQWLEALRTIVAWRLYAAAMQTVETAEDPEPLQVD